MAPAQLTVVRLTRGRLGALAIVGALGCATLVPGCSFDHDVGDSSTEQLCDVLKSEIEGPDVVLPFTLVDLIEELTADPHDRPAATLAIAVAYTAKKDEYRELGPFRPAIEYLARAGAVGADDPDRLPAPSAQVRRSAEAADEALAAGRCSA